MHISLLRPHLLGVLRDVREAVSVHAHEVLQVQQQVAGVAAQLVAWDRSAGQ